MIYYKNHKNYIKSRSVRLPLSTFQGLDERLDTDTLPTKSPRDMSGFRIDNGMLTSDTGVSELLAEDGSRYEEVQFAIDNIYPFYLGGKRQIIASSETRAFILDEVEKRWKIVPNTYFSGQNSVLFTVGEDPSIIIPKEGAGLYSYNGYDFVDTHLSYCPTTMCAHMNRLFIVNKGDEYRLRYSGVNDPFNFDVSLDAGGEIYLDVEDGRILRMISKGGNLYIFREYAIYKLTAYADQRDFVLKRVVGTTSKIDASTIALTDNVMIFRMGGGLYIFDGYSMTRILDNIERTLSQMNDGGEAIFYNGKYYLSYRIGSETQNSHMLIYDMDKRTITIIHDVHVAKMSIVRSMSGKDELAVVPSGARRLGVIDNSGKYFASNIKNTWHSAVVSIDGDYARKKKVLGFYANTSDRYTFIIETADGTRRVYDVDGDNPYYIVNLSSETYTFTIISEGVSRVHSPILDIKA